MKVFAATIFLSTLFETGIANKRGKETSRSLRLNVNHLIQPCAVIRKYPLFSRHFLMCCLFVTWKLSLVSWIPPSSWHPQIHRHPFSHHV